MLFRSFNKEQTKINKIPRLISISIGSIIGFMSGLVGIDYNFRVHSSDDIKYLLKISRSDFNSDYIDYQIKLLDHLKKDCDIDFASNINTIEGKPFCIEKDSFGKDRSIS